MHDRRIIEEIVECIKLFARSTAKDSHQLQTQLLSLCQQSSEKNRAGIQKLVNSLIKIFTSNTKIYENLLPLSPLEQRPLLTSFQKHLINYKLLLQTICCLDEPFQLEWCLKNLNLIKDKDTLELFLIFLPTESKAKLAQARDNLLTSFHIFLEVLQYLPYCDRLAFAIRYKEFISNGFYDLPLVMQCLTGEDPEKFVREVLDVIADSYDLGQVLRHLHSNSQQKLVLENEKFIHTAKDLQFILRGLSAEHRLSIACRYPQLILSGSDLANTVETFNFNYDKDQKVLGQLLQQFYFIELHINKITQPNEIDNLRLSLYLQQDENQEYPWLMTRFGFDNCVQDQPFAEKLAQFKKDITESITKIEEYQLGVRTDVNEKIIPELSGMVAEMLGFQNTHLSRLSFFHKPQPHPRLLNEEAPSERAQASCR